MKERPSASSRGKVLVVDADARRASELCSRLRFLNYEPVTLEDETPRGALIKDFGKEGVAVMLGRLEKESAAGQIVTTLTAGEHALPVLRIDNVSAGIKVDRALSDAAVWALDAPLRRSQLSHLLQRAERYRGVERRNRLTGESYPIRAVRQKIEQVAGFDTTVLVTGESGTGKELVARTIHELSGRAKRPFVPINCGAIPAELLESELFGHEKGAFTGALSSRKGRFELADGGTLFLDEIGDMSLEMQAKLLRVLQERSFEPVGSNKTRRCNVRIIAATHRNLPNSVKEGEFREDLFYRLAVFPLRMPALRKRASDLPALLDELLILHSAEGEGGLRLKADAIGALARYPWPGNVRELSNLVERLAILHPEGEIGVEALPEKYRFCESEDTDGADTDMSFEKLNLKQHLGDIERTLIEQALAEAGGVVAKAARLLKLRRTTLVEKLGKYGIAT